MDDKCMKRGSILFIVTKMQIKTIMKYHFSFNVLVKIKNMDNSKCGQRCGEMGTIKHYCGVNCYSYSGEQFDSF